LEATLLRLIEHEVSSPDAVAHLTKRIGEALSQPRFSRPDVMKKDLDRAREELENIKSAIRQGLITATTKAMLEEAEASLTPRGSPPRCE